MEWFEEHISPPDDIDVLVTDGNRMTVSSYSKSNEMWEGGNILSNHITHWSYLPSQPDSSKREDYEYDLKIPDGCNHISLNLDTWETTYGCGTRNTTETP